MALNAYLKLKGEKAGNISGSVIQKGREGLILVVAVDHLLTAPRDAASGQATGKRQHQPLVITKEVDKATPALHQALVSNELIKEFRLDFWRPNTLGTAGGSGVESQYYSIELIDASIASIKLEMLNNKYPENQSLAVREKVAFTYRKIVWTYQDGGLLAYDDWLSLDK